MTPYEQARQALADHDRTHFMSDSHEVLKRGWNEVAHICDLLDQLTAAEVAQLADEFFETPIDVELAGRFHAAWTEAA